MFQALAQNTDLKERLRRIHAESLLLDSPAAAKSGDNLAEVGKASRLGMFPRPPPPHPTAPVRPCAPLFPGEWEWCSPLCPPPQLLQGLNPALQGFLTYSCANCIVQLLPPSEVVFLLYFFTPFPPNSRLLFTSIPRVGMPRDIFFCYF